MLRWHVVLLRNWRLLTLVGDGYILHDCCVSQSQVTRPHFYTSPIIGVAQTLLLLLILQT